MKGSYKILEQMMREINLSPLEHPARLVDTIKDYNGKEDIICFILFDMGSEHNTLVKDERSLGWVNLIGDMSKEMIRDEMAFNILRKLILNK